jgi:hypothetical protein
MTPCVSFIAIRSDDIEKSASFYASLGFTPVR